MLKLTIGNKVYSSWSMRPWLVLREFQIPFEEVVVPLYRDGWKDEVLARSPTGKVPALDHDGLRIWDSLAIIEYLAELFPDRAIWPWDPAARATARALACEMHSGFSALRNECPMNFGRAPRRLAVSKEAAADVARVDSAWKSARAVFGANGSFLFGAFSAADAMFAPVVQRLRGYDLGVSSEARSYIDAVMGLASWRAWEEGARSEPWVIEKYGRG